MHKRQVIGLQEAREILTRLIGDVASWTPMDIILQSFPATRELRATGIASAFSASLELCLEGKMELRQDRPFAPLYVRGRPAAEP